MRMYGGQVGRLVAGAAMLACSLACSPASGQTLDCAACRTDRYTEGVPRDYELLVVVNDAAQQRKSAQGRLVAETIGEMGLLPETERAWNALARALEWTPEMAFDELLGRRLALVARGLDRQTPEWAIVTEVSPETEKRLRSALRAAPRGRVEGLAVLAVEDGRYELAIGRAPAIDPALATEPVTVSVLLGPRGGEELFRELVPSLLARTGLASPSRRWRVGELERECDIAMLLRRGQPGADGAMDELLLTAMFERGGWNARVVCTPGMAGWAGGGREEQRPWSEHGFRAIERDAFFAVMGSATGGLTSPQGLADLLMPGLPGIAAQGPRGAGDTGERRTSGQRMALAVRPAGASDEKAPVRRESRGVLVGTDDKLVPLSSGKSVRERTAGQVSLMVAVESRTERAVDGDLAAVRMMQWLQTGEAVGGQTAWMSPMQLDPDGGPAFRHVPLDGTFPIDAAIASRLELLCGREPVLAWGGSRVGAVANSAAGAGRPAWWVASIAPSGRTTVERDAAALAAAASAATLRRVSIGSLKPAAMSRWMGGAVSELSPMIRALRRVESIQWDSWMRADGKIESIVHLRMTP